jgi:hypothetical protein
MNELCPRTQLFCPVEYRNYTAWTSFYCRPLGAADLFGEPETIEPLRDHRLLFSTSIYPTPSVHDSHMGVHLTGGSPLTGKSVGRM